VYFCINCVTGKEEEIRNRITKFLSLNIQQDYQVWFPLKENSERRNQKTETRNRPLFPGYLFIWWNGEDEKCFPFYDLYLMTGVVRVLKYNDGSHNLQGSDAVYARWIHTNNGIIRQSKVLLQEGQRLHILEGPLKGMDANVVRVDKHHKRIKVRIDFAGRETDIIFSVEFVEKSTRRVPIQEQILSSPDTPSDQPSDSDKPSQDLPD
jgi:transcriptional antiterminator NusG